MIENMNHRETQKRAKELSKAPKTLDEAIQFLLNNIKTEDAEQFAKKPEHSAGVDLHFNAGMAMRNGWGLWIKEQPLTQWFRNHRVWHADDMSAIIYHAVWCKLNDKSFDIEKEADYYVDYWASQGFGFDGKPVKDYIAPTSLTIKLRSGKTIHISRHS